jgi:sigma-B regulation protein RsbU (phosphoserine phosphatase)
MTILIVDDSEDSRDLIGAALRSGGYEAVHGAASAAEGLKYLGIGRHPPGEAADVDLVLLDVLMPGGDGIEACGHIRADMRYADVPIIMVTSLIDMDSLSSAFAAGANGYFTKPINRDDLLVRVRGVLALKPETSSARKD